MKAVLLSTYDMGHQPFGLASPAAWLRARGHEVVCADLAVDELPLPAVAEAGIIAFHLPMHTATRLALPVIERVRRMNPAARLVAYGLYAPLNESLLREMGVDAIVGGEFEAGLSEIADGGAAPRGSATPSPGRTRFTAPSPTNRAMVVRTSK